MTQIKIYDFKRPERFSSESIRGLALVHDRFAINASLALSRLTRTEAQVSVTSVDQIAYDDFIRSLPNPGVICEFAVEGAAGMALLALAPDLAFALIETLAGGPGSGDRPERSLSGAETALIEGVAVRLLGCLREAWETELGFRLHAIESDPRFVRVAPPGETVAFVTLEVGLGEIRSQMSLCLPYPALEPFLSSRAEAHAAQGEPLLGSEELGRMSVQRYAIFKAEGEDPTARDLAALLAAGKAPAFESWGRAEYGPRTR
jgi:flagellar motor switch protein FliM